MASTPVASGEWRAVVTTALTAKAAARAQDRADIMRIGDLVEHQHGAVGRDVLDVERGEGIGLDQQALMHGVGREPRRDRVRPHDLGRDGEREAFSVRRCAAFSVAKILRTVRRGLASAAATVCQP